MKETLISKISELIAEYQYESDKMVDVSASMSEYYEGKAEALREVVEMLNEIE